MVSRANGFWTQGTRKILAIRDIERDLMVPYYFRTNYLHVSMILTASNDTEYRK